jgi:hypothetical protein
MEQFIQENRTLIFSTLYMVFGLMAAGYALFYSRLDAQMADLKMASQQLTERKTTLSKKLAEIKAAELEQEKAKTETEEKITGGINYLPHFLMRINQIAKLNNVIIRTLTPDTDDNSVLRFRMEVITDYYTFIRFTFQLESLDIYLDDLAIHSYDQIQTPPLHAIQFTLIPRNDAQPLSDTRLEELGQWITQKNRRNPFQRFAFDPNRAKARPVIDLTWIHKLGGIGLSQDGKPYATIDQRPYREGDLLSEERRIEKIEADHVVLFKETPDGKIQYVLKFRRSAKPTTK